MPFKQQPFWNLTTPGRIPYVGNPARPDALASSAELSRDSASALIVSKNADYSTGDSTLLVQGVSGQAHARLRGIGDNGSILYFDVNASARWAIAARRSVDDYSLGIFANPGAGGGYGIPLSKVVEVTRSGRIMLGGGSDVGNGVCQVPLSTLANGGYAFGDFSLYRTGTAAARLTAALTVDGVLSGNGSGLTSLPWSSLTGVPALAASSQWADILSKPAFAAIATSGAWSDLSGKPAALAAISDIGANCGAVISGTGDDAGLNANFVNIETRINAIINRLRTFGLPIINT